MAVDLQWDLLTNSSANLGNALVQGAGQIRQRRETAKNRDAVRNYLSNPEDQAAFAGLAERSPEMAFRIQDQHVERARQLRADHQQQLQFIGRLVHDVHDEAGYRNALALARQAGIDTSGYETYDPNLVSQLQELDRRLNRVAPVNVPEGGTLVDPETGAVVGRGRPPRPRYYPVQPGGTLVLDPSYQEQPAGASAPMQPPMPTGEAPAFNPAPAGAPSQFADVPTGNPLDPNLGQQQPIVRVSTPQEAAALPPGTRYMTPDGRMFVR